MNFGSVFLLRLKGRYIGIIDIDDNGDIDIYLREIKE